MIAVVFVSTMVSSAAFVATPTDARQIEVAAYYTHHAQCVDRIFMIPTWYRGLKVGDCAGVSPDGNNGEDLPKFLTILVMNIVQALLVVAAYVTVFFVIKGGFGYMTSAGSPEGMTSARKTITNALIGMVIAILAASIVNAIAGAIG